MAVPCFLLAAAYSPPLPHSAAVGRLRPRAAVHAEALGRLVAPSVMARRPRAAIHATAESGGGGGGWFSKLAALFEDEVETPEARAAIESLCRPSGWRVRCSIGSDVARALGSSGSLSKRDTSQVGLDAVLRFIRDESFDPPQGSLRLLSSSRLLSSQNGFWRVTATDDSGIPTSVQWRLGCAGIPGGGELLVPEGPLYGNAMLGRRADGGITLGDGRLTVKEELGFEGAPALFSAKGILAEFKIVGSFDMSPAPPVEGE